MKRWRVDKNVIKLQIKFQARQKTLFLSETLKEKQAKRRNSGKMKGRKDMI